MVIHINDAKLAQIRRDRLSEVAVKEARVDQLIGGTLLRTFKFAWSFASFKHYG